MILELHGIETTLGSTSKEYLLHDLILDKEKIGMKLDKNIIVIGEAMNKYKIFMCIWNMKDIFKMNIMGWSVKDSMTNMFNTHACSIRHVHLILTTILLGDVIHCTAILVPIGVDTIGGHSGRC
uniref:Uncharacterized protein n=1 Tax=Arundo donax TaxID=35708 RepID=A0A0A8XNM1_ARUDO